MATTNGVLTPPEPMPVPAPNTADNKRKREDDDAPAKENSSTASSRNAQTQRDILEILQQYELPTGFARTQANN